MTIAEHEQELADLVIYFQTAKFPQLPIKLNKYISIVGNPLVTVEMEALRIQNYKGTDQVRDSLFKHLRELKAICQKQTS